MGDINDLKKGGIISYPIGELNPNFILIGLISGVGGALSIYGELYYGGVLFIPFIATFFHKVHMEVDIVNKRMRMVTKFIKWTTWGGWKKLPELKYISVFKTLVSRTYSGRYGNQATDSYNVIQINLITSKNKKIKLYQSVDEDEAFKIAKQCAQELGLDIWDATSKKAKWL